MSDCYITRRSGGGTNIGNANAIYPIGEDGRPVGNVILPPNVTSLYQYIFQNDANVETITFRAPENITELEQNCLSGCTGLKTIDFSGMSITAIPNNCCTGDKELRTVSLNGGINKIGQNAFQNCQALSDIEGEVTSDKLEIGNNAFYGSSLTNESVNKLGKAIGGNIGSSVFSGITTITDVTVKVTGGSYFANCTQLRRCTILESQSNGNIGSSVFSHCTSLQEAVLPEDVKTLDGSAFSSCSELKNIVLPETLTAIQLSCFENSGLLSLSLPKSVTNIGNGAFGDCSSLETVIVDGDSGSPDITLGNSVFIRCASLKDEVVSNLSMRNWKTVGANIFNACTGLRNVVVQQIGQGMFSGCTGLISCKVTKPNASAAVSRECFSGCTSLESVEIPDGYTRIEIKVFYNCTSLKKVKLPAITSVTSNSLTNTSSSYYAFYGCTALEEVTLGEGWSLSIRLDVSENLTKESMTAMFNAIADLSGKASQTITLGAVNLAKLTGEEKAVATNKNWILA